MYLVKKNNGEKKDEVIMKKGSFGSNCVYPSIFKEYFLEAINESGYKDKVVYKDLENLSINLIDIKVNMYSVNMFLGTIFRHYKKVKYSVLQVRRIYHTNFYQLYNAKISIDFKGSKWLMDLNVGNTLKEFPLGLTKYYTLNGLMKKIEIKYYRQEEKLADLFYRITNNLNINAIELYNLYLIYYSNINVHDLGIALENLYHNVDCDIINKKITRLSSSRNLKNKWLMFKAINEGINIEYEDIMCCLYLILLKLKERIEK